MKFFRQKILPPDSRYRGYSTKYTAKIISTSSTGRSISAEVPPPPTLPTDSRGYPVPRHHIVCKASKFLTHSPTAESLSDLSQYLSSLNPTLTSSEASLILKSLNSAAGALKFFHLCPSISSNFRHDTFTYARIILILSKSYLPDRVNIVRSILAEMEAADLRGNISVINILIGFFGDSEDLEMCLRLMKKWELEMNAYSYKCLLQAYLRSRDSDKAFGVYVDVKKKGYKLDVFAYNMLLDALAKDDKDHTPETNLFELWEIIEEGFLSKFVKPLTKLGIFLLECSSPFKFLTRCNTSIVCKSVKSMRTADRQWIQSRSDGSYKLFGGNSFR